jgi:hypothetical protein
VPDAVKDRCPNRKRRRSIAQCREHAHARRRVRLFAAKAIASATAHRVRLDLGAIEDDCRGFLIVSRARRGHRAQEVGPSRLGADREHCTVGRRRSAVCSRRNASHQVNALQPFELKLLDDRTSNRMLTRYESAVQPIDFIVLPER